MLVIAFVRADKDKIHIELVPRDQLGERQNEVDVVLVRPELRRIEKIRPLDLQMRNILRRGCARAGIERELRRRVRKQRNAVRRNRVEVFDLLAAHLRPDDHGTRALEKPVVRELAPVPHAVRAHLRKPRRRAVLEVPDHRDIRKIGVVNAGPEEPHQVGACCCGRPVDRARPAPMSAHETGFAQEWLETPLGESGPHRLHGQPGSRHVGAEGLGIRFRAKQDEFYARLAARDFKERLKHFRFKGVAAASFRFIPGAICCNAHG